MKNLTESIVSSNNAVNYDIKRAGSGLDMEDRSDVARDYFGNELAEGDHIVMIVNNKELQACEITKLDLDSKSIEVTNLRTKRKIPQTPWWITPVCVKLPK